MLQCVAVCCSVLQCVAVCCSVNKQHLIFSTHNKNLAACSWYHSFEVLLVCVLMREGRGGGVRTPSSIKTEPVLSDTSTELTKDTRTQIHMHTYTHNGITVSRRSKVPNFYQERAVALAKGNTLQHTATHCHTLQHTVSYEKNGILAQFYRHPPLAHNANKKRPHFYLRGVMFSVYSKQRAQWWFRCGPPSELQCVVVCCSVLQCVL